VVSAGCKNEDEREDEVNDDIAGDFEHCEKESEDHGSIVGDRSD
jgi:hypothetical protein